MSNENLTKLVGELAEVIKFHELEAVDSKAAELLEQVDLIEKGLMTEENMESWNREFEQANMHELT